MWLNIIRFLGLIKILIIGFNIFCVKPACANDSVKIYQLTKKLQFKTIDQIRAIPQERWELVKTPEFGRGSGYGWVKIEVNSNANSKFFLEIQNHFIDSVAIWAQENIKTIYHINTDYKLLPSTSSPIQHRYYLFQIPNAHSTIIYVRGFNLKGDAIKLPIKVWGLDNFLFYYSFSSWSWFLFLGIMIVIIIISLVNFLFFPSKIFLYYSGYIFCMTAYAFINDGWATYIPQPFSRLDDHNLLIHCLNGGIVLFLLFSREFLEIQSRNKTIWQGKLLPVLLGCLMVLVLTISTLCFHYQVKFFNILSTIRLLILVSYFGIWAYYVFDAISRDFKPVWIYLIAVLFLVFFVLFVKSGMINSNISDIIFFRIGMTLDAFLLIVGWIYKNSLITKEEQQLEIVKLKNEKIAKIDNEKTLQMGQALQRQRERLARDLHDGIGTNLTHIAGQLDILAIKGGEVVSLNKLSDFVRDTNRQLRETLWILNQNEVSVEEFWQRLLLHLSRISEGRDIPQLIMDMNCKHMLNISPVIASSLFYIIQESVTNAIKHAHSNNIWLNFEVNQNIISINIIDDGVGIKEGYNSCGYGLSNIQNRAKDINADIVIDSDNTGTSIQLILNLSQHYMKKYVN